MSSQPTVVGFHNPSLSFPGPVDPVVRSSTGQLDVLRSDGSAELLAEDALSRKARVPGVVWFADAEFLSYSKTLLLYAFTRRRWVAANGESALARRLFAFLRESTSNAVAAYSTSRYATMLLEDAARRQFVRDEWSSRIWEASLSPVSLSHRKGQEPPGSATRRPDAANERLAASTSVVLEKLLRDGHTKPIEPLLTALTSSGNLVVRVAEGIGATRTSALYVSTDAALGVAFRVGSRELEAMQLQSSDLQTQVKLVQALSRSTSAALLSALMQRD